MKGSTVGRIYFGEPVCSSTDFFGTEKETRRKHAEHMLCPRSPRDTQKKVPAHAQQVGAQCLATDALEAFFGGDLRTTQSAARIIFVGECIAICRLWTVSKGTMYWGVRDLWLLRW